MSNAGEPLNFRKLLQYALQGITLGIVAMAIVTFFTAAPDTLVRLRDFPWRILPVLLTMVVIAWLCNGCRVWIMCKSLGHSLHFGQALVVSLSTEFGIAASPAGMGGTAIRLAFLHKAGVPVASSASMLAADAALDSAFFILLAPLVGFILWRDGAWQNLLASLPLPSGRSLLTGSMVLAAAVLIVRWSVRHVRWVHHLVAETSWGHRVRLRARVRHARREFVRDFRLACGTLGFLFRYRRKWLLANFMFACVQWLCRYGILPLLVLACNPKMNPFPLFLVQGLLFMLSLALVLPGGGGGLELTTPLILQFFVEPAFIAIILLVWRFFTYHLYLLAGGSVFFWACHCLDRVFPGRQRQRHAPQGYEEELFTGPTVPQNLMEPSA
jgi:uncharacterized protein (TIRG00374 family)